MRLVTAEEMRAMDQSAIRDYRIPGLILMENAGLGIVQVITTECFRNKPAGKRVLIVAGPGNNGGDGLVVGRHLHNRGARVEIWLTADPNSYRGDAAVNLQIVQAMGIPLLQFEPGRLSLLKERLRETDLVVDALFGTGFRGVAAEPLASLINLVNEAGVEVLAVDLPSGMEADSGRVNGPCFLAKITVTMGMPKIGLYVEPGASYAGKIFVADISFPPELKRQEGDCHLIEDQMVAAVLPRRRANDHKGIYGHVVVIGGTLGYTGAAVMAANTALRSGAGLVTAVVPESVYQVAAVKLTEVMTRPAADQKGGRAFAPEALRRLEELLGRATVLAVGPGLGREPETAEFLQRLLEETDLPLVLDADALNLLAEKRELLTSPAGAERRRRWILTPHPGEMGRLLGIDSAQVQRERLKVAETASKEWGLTLVLKGSHTIIAGGGQLLINPTGNPGLATGGSGDVLTGLIAGLLAQGLSPLRAAAAGAYLHGLAADRMAERTGMAGLVAGDLTEELPATLKQLERE